MVGEHPYHQNDTATKNVLLFFLPICDSYQQHCAIYNLQMSFLCTTEMWVFNVNYFYIKILKCYHTMRYLSSMYGYIVWTRRCSLTFLYMNLTTYLLRPCWWLDPDQWPAVFIWLLLPISSHDLRGIGPYTYSFSKFISLLISHQWNYSWQFWTTSVTHDLPFSILLYFFIVHHLGCFSIV